jgi:hypothetical protein
MNRMLLVLAWLGFVLVVLVTQMFLPDSREGRTLAFIVCFLALFPLARTLWFVNVPVWRYWAGLAVGTVVFWLLETYRVGLAPEASYRIAVVFFTIVSVGFVYDLWRRRRSSSHAK